MKGKTDGATMPSDSEEDKSRPTKLRDPEIVKGINEEQTVTIRTTKPAKVTDKE